MAATDPDVPSVSSLPLPVALRRVTRDILATLEWHTPGWLAYWGAVGLCFFLWSLALLVWAYQIYSGLHITGLLHPVMWGAYITTFVFWIGIAHSGTLISAILFLFRARWRTSIARAAETMTIVAIATAGLFPILHLGRAWRFYWLIPYPNERGLWVNFSSPLIWDAVAVGTYFVASVLFWFLGLIPDFASVRDHTAGWRGWIFGRLAVGWRGSAHEWRHFRSAYAVLAGLITALVISVHSIVSWDFAVAIVPGWHSTIFAPYFVAGAVFSGLAMILTLVVPGRVLLGIREYVTDDHLEQVAKLIVAVSLIVTYSYASELFFAWYRGEPAERSQFLFRAAGTYAPLVWLAIVCNSIVPLAFLRRAARRSPAVLFAISIAINIGMWIERFVIVVGSLSQDFLPSAWRTFTPTFWDWSMLFGTLGLFTALMFLFVRLLPIIPAFEMRRLLREMWGERA